MRLEYCDLDAFSVIGRLGSTEMEPDFVKRLYAELEQGYKEIKELTIKDANGNIKGIWGLMSDFSGQFAPWENYQKGLYLAGVEVASSAVAPAGWVKWDVPKKSYIRVMVTSDTYGEVFQTVINEQLPHESLALAGAIFDYSDWKTGQDYFYFPIKSI